ncbi:MAG: ATP-binding protein [Euryarchaeota archaeon]|nr:ATP-binding protein [Euryarchaeota archaeon]
MEERHKLLLIKLNPWWNNQTVTLPTFERDLLQEILQYLPYKQVLTIIGLRRVGKTIIMKQIIQKIQEPKQNICYISFDDIDFQDYRIAEDLINYFLEYSDKNKKRYLFLDEIQKLPHWADLIKTYYDNEENLKIILSGSASLEVKKGKETLAGRILSFHLPVVSFSEYVRYFKKDHTISTDNIFREYDLQFAEKKETYQTLWNEYLIKGAFPELIDIPLSEKEYITKYIKESVIEKSISDIARITNEDEKLIYELFRLLANSNARLFEIINLANILKINRNRLSHYISLLEKSFLITIAYNYTASVAKQVRSNKKQYIAHSSLVIAILDYPFEVLTTELSGHLVEGVITTSIKNSSFWRSPQKDEVDIITKEGFPIEVKYQTQITSNDIRSLLKFCKKFRKDKGIVLTKNLLEKHNIENIDIQYLPAWFYSLMQHS